MRFNIDESEENIDIEITDPSEEVRRGNTR